jgi:hypothetical protein
MLLGLLGILMFCLIFITFKNLTKVKFLANCSDAFIIPKQSYPKRFVAIPGHFDLFTADEQDFVDSKLLPLYPTEEKAINKFISSLQCGDKLFLKLVSINPDFATTEGMLLTELERQEKVFKNKEIYNLEKIQTKCGEYFTFEVDNKKYYTKVFLDKKPDTLNVPYQKLTITNPLEDSITISDCL